MNLFLNFQPLLRLALALLMGLLPLYGALAQESGQQKRKMHIKMIRTVDGKTEVIDTTITAETEEAIAKALKAARLDTAQLRLMDEKIRAYTLGKEGDAVFKARVHSLKADTAMRRAMKEVHVLTLSADSLSKEMVKRFKVIQGDSLLMGAGPRVFMQRFPDSAFVHFEEMGKAININPKEIERIIVSAMPSQERIDSLMKLHENVNFKVIVKDGQKKVYRIDRDGKEEEVTGEEAGFHFARPGRAIFIVRKAKVEDVTKADKEQLKATGAPVEMKSREELKMEEIHFSPNPNNGRFNLKFSLKNKGTTVVRVMDDKGREVFVDTVENLTGTYERDIDLTPFGRGLYFLQLAQGDRYHTKKILVQ
ncbi:T9SS type A sorting domain-containing protein [Pontibacter sp. HSC-14F20]|uniref:T9SS type A sorting domain-containing protein n=1 Tax=Pontibacter sp. HSC-14F20 TaxID=2864136 RepID=UPI001C7377D0|nr:T9SS type A sorting domain-containing protein [Pontibacter sp. HSC-14F20]MBX0332479.1 T9SS type A sorting domain-containing protein [Pontibacter sp. HSC-14F20]